MEMVIIGKGGERYHEEFCPYVLRIDKKSRKEVTIREAERRGYHACKFCCSVKGIAYNNRINYGRNCFYDKVDDAICVRTDVGFWKIIWNDEWADWHLFHMNRYGYKCFDPKRSSKELARGRFHSQLDFKHTTHLDRIFKYIEKHDKKLDLIEGDYKSLPKATKQQRKYRKQAKKRKQRQDLRRLDMIFKEMEKSK